jgi:glyoxylase-like metal-dependent hydrolase (beta-lactamase superfamily II)
VVIELQRKTLGGYQTNSYLLIDQRTTGAILIDAPAEAETLLAWAEPFNIKQIVLTHGHSDHTGALDELRSSLRVPLVAHPADVRDFNIVDELHLEDGGRIPLGDAIVEIAHIPGHTPGSIALKVLEPDGFRLAIVGDAIFPGGPGHTVSSEALRQSLDALENTFFSWPDEVELHPGHGSSTTVGAERPAFEAFRKKPIPPDLYGDVLWG